MSAPPLLLTRARLRRDVSPETLRAVLAPGGGARAATTHHMIWHLFGDAAERRRDFLWREAEPGLFYLLSARAPEDRRALFDLDPPKSFTPHLTVGDRLSFVLRANATVARKTAPTAARGKRRDVVMDVIYASPGRERAAARARALAPAARRWLTAQGDAHGFGLVERPRDPAWGDLDGVADGRAHGGAPDADAAARDAERAVRVLGYQSLRIGRGGAAPMRVGVLDMEGVLEVRDPERLVAALGAGFGRAKAFGCGLMLVRRAPAWA